MMSSCCNCKAVAETQTEAIQLSYADVSTQTVLLRTGIVVQTLGYMELWYLDLVWI